MSKKNSRSRSTQRILVALIIVVGAAVASSSSSSVTAANDEGSAMPGWLRNHMGNMVGTWHSTRSLQEGEQPSQQPSQQWAQEWRWGIGQQTLHGSLFPVNDGVPVLEHGKRNDLWEFWLMWNPEQRIAEAHQVNGDGWYGVGAMRLISESEGQREMELIQKFTLPDARSFTTKHIVFESSQSLRMEVFNLVEQEWKLDHEMSWERASTAD